MLLRSTWSRPFSSSPPQVDRIWLWVYYNKIPLYPIFYLHSGDYKLIAYSILSLSSSGDIHSLVAGFLNPPKELADGAAGPSYDPTI